MQEILLAIPASLVVTGLIYAACELQNNYGIFWFAYLIALLCAIAGGWDGVQGGGGGSAAAVAAAIILMLLPCLVTHAFVRSCLPCLRIVAIYPAITSLAL